jgi:predicted acyltransferase
MNAPPRQRLHSLDQFRGYTVAGMFLVNFLGGFAAIHPLLKHHNTYCSYADTIMPQFFFAVGFALRLAFLRHVEKVGRPAAYRQAVMRGLGLVLVGAVVYHLDGKFPTWESLTAEGVSGFLSNAWRRSLFQALVHIGVTSIWVLPVIAASARAQVLWMAGSAALHVVLSATWWHDWLRANRVIDGGPLGFLTWTIPVLAGSLTYMYLEAHGRDKAFKPFLQLSAAAMLAGYALSCLTSGGVLAAPPFFPPWHERDMWTMSQQAGSVSYLLFSTGFSLAVYTFFLWWTDVRGRQWSVFRTLGVNALAGYVLHMLVEEFVKPFAPKDSPLSWALFSFLVFFTITWLFLRSLEKNNVYIKL